MTGGPAYRKKDIRQTKRAVGYMLVRLVTSEGGDSIRESRRWQAKPIEKMKVVIIKDSESVGQGIVVSKFV